MAEDAEETGGDEGAESNGSGNGGGGALRSALTSKELLIPAALSAASAVAATKGPDLIRSLTHATEEKAGRLAEKGDGRSSVLSSAAERGWKAASGILIPIAEDAAESAGKYLAEHGPDIVRERIAPRFIEAFNEAS